jgi:hypothetical protein
MKTIDLSLEIGRTYAELRIDTFQGVLAKCLMFSTDICFGLKRTAVGRRQNSTKRLTTFDIGNNAIDSSRARFVYTFSTSAKKLD